MSQRTDRVDELLRQEIGQILAKELADPRIGFATITDVETAPDLRHAKVWVSVIGDKTNRTETLRALQASMGFVRHELGKRLRIKRIPALHIHLDDSAERGTRVLHLLTELESGVDPQEVTPFNETLPTPVKRLPHEGDVESEDEVSPTDVAAAGAGSQPGVLPPIPPAPASGRRPWNRRGPGGNRPGRGAQPATPRRKPGTKRG